MAIPTSFKQQCPSCEAMVPIRDPKLIGRKIDCPKCKYRFVVEEPVDEVEEVEEGGPAKKGKGGATGIINKKPASGKASKAPTRRRADDDEDIAPRPKKQQGGSGMLVVGIALAAVAIIALAVGGYFLIAADDDDSDEGSSRSPSASAPPPSDSGEVKKPEPPPKPEGPKPRHEDITNLLPNDTQVVLNLPLEFLLGKAKVNQALLKTPGAFHEVAFQRTWGIAPNYVRRVVLAFNTEKSTVFSVMRTSMALKEKQIVEGLKLKSEKPINGMKYYLVKKPFDALSTFLLKGNVYHDKVALHFMDPFTVICADAGPMNQFLQEKGQPRQLSKKLDEEEQQQGGEQGGRPGAAPPGGGPGGPVGAAPPGAVQGGPPGGGPGGPPGGMRGGYGGGYQPPDRMSGGMAPPGITGGGGGINEAAPVSSSYMTIDPQIKRVLDQVEKVDKSENQNVLLSFALSTSAVSVNDLKKLMAQAQAQQGSNVPQVPDVALKMALDNLKGELKAVGVAVTEFSESKLIGNTAVATKDTATAKDWEKKASEIIPTILDATGLDFVSRNAGRNDMMGMYGRQGGMQGGPPGGSGPMGPGPMPMGPPGGGNRPMGPSGGGPGAMGPPGGGRPMGPSGGYGPMGPRPMGPGGGGGFQGMQQPSGQGNEQPQEKGKLGNYGTWLKDNVLALGITFNLNADLHKNVGEALEVLSIFVRSEAAVSDRQSHIHELAAAMQAYLEKEGHFPRGAVPRPPDAQRVLDWRPDQRLSWMTQILPYLGNGEFRDVMPDDKNKDKYKYAWYEGPYVKAGMAVIPQFVAPAKDDVNNFYVQYPNLPVKGPNTWAMTHFVGMAGVGLDAAEYRTDDASTAKKRGVFGYDRETKKDDIKDGPDQTIVLIQVPPEPKAPWIAGGGSTVRGVSEDLDCVQPFVCTEYKGKRGTFAIMADGKVRFIPANIDPKTFQALCTISGDDKIRDLDKVAPEVPPPEDFVLQPELKTQQPAPAAPPPAAKSNVPAGWQQVDSKEGGYRVFVPAGARQEQTQSQQFPEGKVTVHQIIVQVPAQNARYIVGYTNLPHGVASQVDQLLDGTRTGALKAIPGGIARSPKKISLDGHPGQEFQVVIAGKIRMIGRAYVVKDRQYILMVGGPQSEAPAKDIQTFFDSFKLIGK